MHDRSQLAVSCCCTGAIICTSKFEDSESAPEDSDMNGPIKRRVNINTPGNGESGFHILAVSEVKQRGWNQFLELEDNSDIFGDKHKCGKS